MARFVKGDVVVVPFPFSDLTNTKRRPALVLATLPGNDLILCQITSQATRDQMAVSITPDDFSEGSLNQISNARPNRLFTADQGIVLYKIGHLGDRKLAEIMTVVRQLFV
jgi:mRNA interferase MazF